MSALTRFDAPRRLQLPWIHLGSDRLTVDEVISTRKKNDNPPQTYQHPNYGVLFKENKWDKHKAQTVKEISRVGPIIKEMHNRGILLTQKEKLNRYSYIKNSGSNTTKNHSIKYSINPDVLLSPYKIILNEKEKTQFLDAIAKIKKPQFENSVIKDKPILQWKNRPATPLTWDYSDVERLFAYRKLSEKIIDKSDLILPDLQTGIENYLCNIFYFGAMNIHTEIFLNYLKNLESEDYSYITILKAARDFSQDIYHLYSNQKLMQDIDRNTLLADKIDMEIKKKQLRRINRYIESNLVFTNYKTLEDARIRIFLEFNVIEADKDSFLYIIPQNTLFFKMLMDNNIAAMVSMKKT